jgi:hypothetical protein
MGEAGAGQKSGRTRTHLLRPSLCSLDDNRADLSRALAASQSRYETQNLLILVGCYLCLLERWPAHDNEIATTGFIVDALRNVDQFGQILRHEWRRVVLVGLRVLAILLIVVEVEGGIANGVPAGLGSQQAFQLDNLVAAHAADARDSLMKSALFPNWDYADANIRNLAKAAKRDHLSFFATSEASRLARMSLPTTKYTPPRTSIGRPADGAQLRGQVYLVAKAYSDYPMRSVDFQIKSSGVPVELVQGSVFLFGWLAVLVTTKLPNGPYTVQSIARDVAGHSTTSQAVPITVKN